MKAKAKPVLLFLLIAAFSMISTGCVDLLSKTEQIRGTGNVTKQKVDVHGFAGVHLATIGTMHIEFGNKTELIVEAEENLQPYIEAFVKEGVLTIKTRDYYSLKPGKPINYYVTVPRLNLIHASSSGDIQAPDINADDLKIITSSSGDIYARNIDAADLEVNTGSSGNISLRDIIATEVSVRVSSSGNVTVRKIEAPTLNARISSSGGVILDILDADNITARISSSGDMRIEKGSVPEQDISISSSGEYRAKNLQSDKAVVSISSSGNVYVNVDEQMEASLSGSGSLYYSGNPTITSEESSSGGIIKSK